jgi:DNA repair exonuclease SbcCD ATPase subunit
MVAKELVLLEDANVSQNSLYDRIQFTNNYVPKDGFKVNNIKHSVEDCKKIFKITFGGEVALNIDYPYLPCSNADNGVASGIVSQGLRHRFTTLAQEIILLESTQKDTAALRTKLGQLDALRELINAIAVSPKCYDYVNQTDSSKVAENLENAQWEAMLRTFATIYLIAKDKAAIAGAPGSLGKQDAVTMIDTVSSQQITEDQLRKYYDAWTAKSENKDTAKGNIKELLDYLNGVPQAALVKATEEKARFESELETARKALDAAETAKNEATTALAAAAGESAEKLAELQRQLTDLSGAATDLADVRAKLGAATSELADAKSQLLTTTNDLKTAQKKNDEIDAKVVEIQGNLAAAEAAAAKATADAITAAADAATALEGERASGAARWQQAQQEAEAAKDRADKAGEAVAAAGRARDDAVKEQKRLQNATAAAETAATAAENALTDAKRDSEKALAEVKAELKTAVAATSSATAEGQELRENLRKALESAKTAETGLDELSKTTSEAAAAATRELEAQKGLTAAAGAELATANKKLAEAEAAQKAAADAAEAKIKELEAQIRALDPTIQAKLTDVTKQLQEAKGELGKARAELKQANADKDDAEKKFAESVPKMVALEEDLKNARLAWGEATTTVADLTAAAAARREVGDAIAIQEAEARQTDAEKRAAAAEELKKQAEARAKAAEAEQQRLRERVNSDATIVNSAQTAIMTAQASAAAAAREAAAALKKATEATAEGDALRAQLEAAGKVATQTQEQLNTSQSATAVAAEAADKADIATQTMANTLEGVDAGVANEALKSAGDVAGPVQPATPVPATPGGVEPPATSEVPVAYNPAINLASVNGIFTLLQKSSEQITGVPGLVSVKTLLEKKHPIGTTPNNILRGSITTCSKGAPYPKLEPLFLPLKAASIAWTTSWESGQTEQQIVTAAQEAFKKSLGICAGTGASKGVLKAIDQVVDDMNPYLERYILAIMRYSGVQSGGGDSYEELADNVVWTLEESLTTCDEDLSICEKEKEEHRQRIEELNATIASLQAELRSQMSNAARVSQDLAAKAADFDETVEDPTEDYKAFIADSQAKLANTDKELKEKRLQIKDLSTASAAADKKAEEAAALIADLKGIIAKLKPASLQGGGAAIHPLMALSAAISEAAANLLPK